MTVDADKALRHRVILIAGEEEVLRRRALQEILSAAGLQKDDFDLEVFALRIGAVLPRYARPVFLRLAKDLASTPTFRPLKTVLQAEGFDPDQITDPLFVAGVGGYAALDKTGYAEILAGRHAL